MQECSHTVSICGSGLLQPIINHMGCFTLTAGTDIDFGHHQPMYLAAGW